MNEHDEDDKNYSEAIEKVLEDFVRGKITEEEALKLREEIDCSYPSAALNWAMERIDSATEAELAEVYTEAER